MSITTMSSKEALVSTILGGNTSATNISYSGTQESGGTFSGYSSILGIDSGIVLSSGKVLDQVGPNSSGSKSGTLGTSGDSDLNNLSGKTTKDASVLEFDFVPQNDVLVFQYVFGSEEYPEYVGSSYNDVFGFFVNGSDVAVLPGSSTPIAINTVNATTNASYYVDNTTGAYNIQPDGFTTVMTVNAKVTKGVTNHIKLAIADATDTIYDSTVFIKSQSFGYIPSGTQLEKFGGGFDNTLFSTGGSTPLNINLNETGFLSLYIYNLGGSTANDTLYGDTKANNIWGSAGDDILSGGGGNDVFWWGAGDGNDVIMGDSDNSKSTVYFYNLTLNDINIAQSGNDILISVKNNTTDTLTFKNWFTQVSSGTEILHAKFSDGQTF